MNIDYKPRFSFEINEEQQVRANRLISAYGMRKAIFGKILDDVLDLIEANGAIVIGVLMSPNISPREILPSINEADKASKIVKKKGGKDGKSR